MTEAAHTKIRRTARTPVTTMEELPILSEEERVAMVDALKAAEARIAAGQYVEHDSTTFVDRLMSLRAAAVRNKSA